MSNLLLSKIGHVISEFPLAFKQTKEVKLFMTLLVKNEEGMLEENLQFHKAMGVDGFIISMYIITIYAASSSLWKR